MEIITNHTIECFKNHLLEEEKSASTVEKYIRDVRCFEKRFHGRKVEKSGVLEYKRELCENYAPRSVNSILSSLNTFFSYISRHDLRVKTLKIQRQIFADEQRELSRGEYERLLSAAKRAKKERLYCLLQALGSTGLRISELSSVTVEAVKESVATINCKGKIRQVFLPKQLCRLLLSYAKKHGIKKGAVFVTKNGNPLNRSNIWTEMKKLCRSANVSEKKVFPHNLRHLFARIYYSIEKDIVRLADILGHSSVNTTRIYTMETGTVHRRQIQQLGKIFIRA